MILRLAKTALVVLLGFLLVRLGVSTLSAGNGPNLTVSCQCCKVGCTKCHMPACCSKPADNHGPLAPTPLPARGPNEWHALAASVSPWLTLPPLSTDELLVRSAPFASLAVVPLFQWDYCYLI